MKLLFTNFWRIAPCLLAIIVDYMGIGLVYPLVAAMFDASQTEVFPNLGSIHLRNFYMGLAFLLYPFGMFFGASFLGDLSDLWGRKKVILLSVGGIAISFLIMGGSIAYRTIFGFLVGRLFSGFMAGSQPLCQAAIADISTKESKPWNMALITLTNCFGLVFGPLIAAIFSTKWFIQSVGFSLPFFVAGLLAICTFLWISLRFKETYRIAAEKKRLSWIRPARIFFEAFKNEKVRLLALVMLFFQLGVALFYQTSAIYLAEKLHYASSTIGYYYGFMGLCFAASTLWVYPYALKHLSLINMSLMGLIIMGLFEMMLPLFAASVPFWLETIGIAIFNVLAWTPLLSIFSNSVDETKQGWVMGIMASAVAIGFIVSGLSTNLLALIGSGSILFIGGVFSILSAYILYRFKKAYLA